jgi:predicted nucleic acid-binding protein
LGKDRIILDSGALSALARGKGRVRRYIERAIEDETEVALPTVVIAESTTGAPRDADLNRVVGALDLVIIGLDEKLARDAGSLRYRARRPNSDTIDAIVVATGDLAAGSTILTGDLDDVTALSAVRGRTLVVSFNDV